MVMNTLNEIGRLLDQIGQQDAEGVFDPLHPALEELHELLNTAQEQHGELLAALEEAQSALQWTSGSPDFGSDGIAEVGWNKIARPALERASALIARVRGGKTVKAPRW